MSGHVRVLRVEYERSCICVLGVVEYERSCSGHVYVC